MQACYGRTFHSLTVLSLVDSSMRVLLLLLHHRTLLIFSSIYAPAVGREALHASVMTVLDVLVVLG